MTLADYRAIKEYRDGLERALRHAAERLSPSDYAAMSRGVVAEIDRVDKEFANSIIAPGHARAAIAIAWTVAQVAVKT